MSKKAVEEMSDKPVYLTREGMTKLEAELEELTTLGRKDVAERIKAAKELGDISESGEYEDAKNSQALLEGRIREIKGILSHAQLITEDSHNHREVGMGSCVTVRFEGDDEEETWSIVGSAEALPYEGKISNESPIGSALIGKKPGQKVTVQTPSGVTTLEIVRIT
jgi:transcription elongation factor GreA